MELIEQFVPVQFDIAPEREPGARRVHVTVRPQR
jgi:hypothetical protein